ncbi:Selenide, water dikinase 1 [Homalodisca vitripennis]|nr:Selenide, water dikinase 1 [Homalodisca vitripennis]
MGRIACVNVVSDLYTVGVTEIDSMHMILAVSKKMSYEEGGVTTELIMEGFSDAAKDAGTKVTGRDTRINPWCTIGCVTTSVCQLNEFIMPINTVAGDVLVLTKVLGTQVACKALTMIDTHVLWPKVNTAGHEMAVNSMARLIKTAAKVMHMFSTHAATDVTGYGILGHAENLAKYQKNLVTFLIHNLPVIYRMAAVAKVCDNLIKLHKGRIPETPGGLLCCRTRDHGEAYSKEIERQEGHKA